MNCIIIGDYGTSDKYQKLVADSMVDLIKEYKIKFICGLGDNIYEAGVTSVNDKQFQTKFEDPYKNQLQEDESSKIVHDLKVNKLKTNDSINEILNRQFREL